MILFPNMMLSSMLVEILFECFQDLFLCSVPKSSVYDFQLNKKITHLVET